MALPVSRTPFSQVDQHAKPDQWIADVLKEYTPDRVAAICGVPEARLRQAAEWIGTSRSTVTTCLQGVYQTNQATAAACAVNNMHLLMGKIGRPGCAPMQFAGQPSSMCTRETGASGTYAGYRNWEDPRHMRDLAGRWTNAERRCTLLRKAVDPPGEARPDLDIFIDFAHRMNLRDADGRPLIGFGNSEGAFDEWRDVSRGCIPDYSGMTYQRLADSGGLQWPCTSDRPDGTVRLYADLMFPTQWHITEAYEKDIETGHEHTLKEYKEKRDPGGRAVFAPAHYQPPLDWTNDDFPLVATSGRQVYHWHTRTKTGRAPALDDAAPGPFVSVNHEDAARLGITDGDALRVVSRHGDLTAPAKVGDVVPPGVVFVPFHYGELGARHAANNLMPNLRDPVSMQPIQKFAAVRIERVASDGERKWW